MPCLIVRSLQINQRRRPSFPWTARPAFARADGDRIDSAVGDDAVAGAARCIERRAALLACADFVLRIR